MSLEALTISQHYLTHLPDMILQLGPPRFYSSRPTERMIGLLKPRIKSPSKPASSACNAMIDITATGQFFRQCVSAKQDSALRTTLSTELSPAAPMSQASSITIKIPDEEATVSLDRLQQDTLDKFNADYKLGDLLHEFYSRHEIDCSDVDNTIYTGYKAVIRGHVFAAKTRQNAKGRNFIKLTLPMDIRACSGLRSTDNLIWCDTFGTALLFFSHTQNGVNRIMCLLRMETDVEPSPITSIPSGNHRGQRLYVTDASHLDCLAMSLHSTCSNKFYYLYPNMFKHRFIDSSKL